MAVARPQNPRSELSTDFRQELCDLVLDTAPRFFAVVQEWEEETGDLNGWVVAWGMAHEDGPADVLSVDGALRMRLGSPERALRLFSREAGVTARIVWLAAPGSAELDRADAA